MLEVKNLFAGYGKSVVLKDLSVSIPKGKLTMVIGPNGCGKSTLFKAVSGIIPKISGEVLVGGVPLSTLSGKEISQRIAYLAQSRQIPDMTVFQLVLHGRFPFLSYPRTYSAKDKELTLSAIDAVGLSGFEQVKVSQLSGGMQQSAFIATALCRNSDYILMDEPTAHLDAAHSLTLLRSLVGLSRQGCGVGVILHDITQALEYADNLIVLNDGKAVFSGFSDAAFECGIIDEVFGIRLKKTADAYYRIELK